MLKLLQIKYLTKNTEKKSFSMTSEHFVLWTFLLLYNTNFSVCIGVKAPSASAATSLSMASSLFNSMSLHPEDNNAIISGDEENGRRPPEECKVKNLVYCNSVKLKSVLKCINQKNLNFVFKIVAKFSL